MKQTTDDATRPRAHQLIIRKPCFDLIVSGTKTVEIRVGYPKIRRMRVGDTLRMISGDDSLTTRVARIHVHDSISALLDAESPTAIGGGTMSPEELGDVIRAIYPPDKEALGVFALHLTTGADPLQADPREG
ncbi:ASCH domain-containing protein [Streptomyces uncialis]|uniref:ASCH domain-containing protein n=1 Tax=Streptomyces uncialis TaxID=1048205 RepID=UPI002254337D|nr:ASCH domain-containing protein [Streptomyces uncialis]MCX4664508.1 ASCH domain-containing protein [Streptomyces uncialis]